MGNTSATELKRWAKFMAAIDSKSIGYVEVI
jgi:hypothetical protein